MTPHPPTQEDAEALARLHVQAWAETYAGLLPRDEIAKADLPRRLRLWQTILQGGKSRVSWIPGCGFASAGVQRDDDLAQAGYPEELYAIYLLQPAQGRGLGLALLRAVVTAQPFSALVVEGNARACGFYERTGARLMTTRGEHIGDAPISERVYVWDHGLPMIVS